jgi:DNA-binding response OmpR family regulator
MTTDRKLIVLVDDDEEFRAIVSRWLQAEYDTAGFDDGADLLAAGDELKPDLVIMDVKLRGLNGFGLCQRLHSESRFSSVPVLFLTGVDSDEGFLLGIDAGGASYLTKPVERSTLLSRVQELVRPKMVA